MLASCSAERSRQSAQQHPDHAYRAGVPVGAEKGMTVGTATLPRGAVEDVKGQANVGVTPVQGINEELGTTAYGEIGGKTLKPTAGKGTDLSTRRDL